MEREIYIHQVLTQLEQARAQGQPCAILHDLDSPYSWVQRLAQFVGAQLVRSGQWLINYGQTYPRSSLEQPP